MKKKHSSLILAAIFILTTLLLSACSSQASQTQTTNKTGFFKHILFTRFQRLSIQPLIFLMATME